MVPQKTISKKASDDKNFKKKFSSFTAYHGMLRAPFPAKL